MCNLGTRHRKPDVVDSGIILLAFRRAVGVWAQALEDDYAVHHYEDAIAIATKLKDIIERDHPRFPKRYAMAFQ